MHLVWTCYGLKCQNETRLVKIFDQFKDLWRTGYPVKH